MKVGGGVLGLVLAPVHASLRSAYILRPSFHSISCFSRRLLLLFRESIGWCNESGLSYLYGSGIWSCGVEASEESESRSRHSEMASGESKASGGEDAGGQVQSSRSFERICCFAVRTASWLTFELTAFFVALGRTSDTWFEREGVS